MAGENRVKVRSRDGVGLPESSSYGNAGRVENGEPSVTGVWFVSGFPPPGGSGSMVSAAEARLEARGETGREFFEMAGGDGPGEIAEPPAVAGELLAPYRVVKPTTWWTAWVAVALWLVLGVYAALVPREVRRARRCMPGNEAGPGPSGNFPAPLVRLKERGVANELGVRRWVDFVTAWNT